MTNQNPYESTADVDRQSTNRNRDCAMILAIVLLSVSLSAFKGVRSLTDDLAAPDATAVVIGAVIGLWVVWITVELGAVRLIWQGRAAGRWILDAADAKAIARGARKHGFDSIITRSVQPGGGVNTIVLDPRNARATGVAQ